eukprot:scaffold171786_cov26-Tisochrysis_lutea.AAC.1
MSHETCAQQRKHGSSADHQALSFNEPNLLTMVNTWSSAREMSTLCISYSTRVRPTNRQFASDMARTQNSEQLFAQLLKVRQHMILVSL